MTEEPPGERPRWSVTWLFRVQRVGRNRPASDGSPQPGAIWRALPWLVIGALVIEVAILVWLGFLPR